TGGPGRGLAAAPPLPLPARRLSRRTLVLGGAGGMVARAPAHTLPAYRAAAPSAGCGCRTDDPGGDRLRPWAPSAIGSKERWRELELTEDRIRGQHPEEPLMTSNDQPAVPVPPDYPMKRACPVDLPPEYARFRGEQPLIRIRLWDGSEAWLATRYQDVRQILVDPRFSIMPSRPGFPFVSASRASMLKGEKHNFAFMDPPEHTGR